MSSDDTESVTKRKGSELVNRLTEPGEFSEERDYIGRYTSRDGDGEKRIDPDSISETGINRILFSMDELASSDEDGKPVYVHVLTGIVELFLGEKLDDS
jgi:hypothetical protein